MAICTLLLLTVKAQETVVYSNIKIGETLPDLELKNIDNYPKSDIKLSELNQQLLIIDFWATWCGPCIAKIPIMDSIMKALPDEMLFLSVSDEPKEKVRNFLIKKEKDTGTKLVIPSIMEDIELSKLFPHYFVPHYVWIKLPERIVIAITGGEDITYNKVRTVINEKAAINSLSKKVDKVIDYKISDPLLPLLANIDSIRQNGFEQYSFFTRYVPGLPAGMFETISADTGKTIRVVVKNSSIKKFAAWAFGNAQEFLQDSALAIETKYPEKIFTNSSGFKYKEWQKKYSYCYELKTSKRNQDKVFEIMQQDIINYFPEYDFNIEKRIKECWVLMSVGNNNLLKSKGGKTWLENGETLKITNFHIKGLIGLIRYPYFSKSSILLADRTNIDFNIDIEIKPKSYIDINEVNSELKRYNLKFERRLEPVDVLVIKDKKSKVQ